METIKLSYGEDKIQNFVALIILVLIVITLISIRLIQHKPIFIGLIGVVFIILMYFIISKALNVPCEVNFSNSIEFKILKTTWFYKNETIVFEKNEIKELKVNKFKGYFYYILKTEKGTIRLQELNQKSSNKNLIQGFEKLGIKIIS